MLRKFRASFDHDKYSELEVREGLAPPKSQVRGRRPPTFMTDYLKACLPGAVTPAAKLLAKLGEGLPLTRDLTDEAETLKVLEIATAVIESGLPLQDFKDACYGDSAGKGAGPTVLVSAVGSAESKLQMKDCGPLHMVCIFAMYGEQNRIQKKADHPNGQDFVRMKVKQLEWLFRGEEGKTWEILAVDDGCPNDSKSLARKVIEAENLGDRVKVLELEDAVREGVPYFQERGLKAGCKESRKGGAILYGLYTAATRQVAPEAPPQLVMYTDSVRAHLIGERPRRRRPPPRTPPSAAAPHVSCAGPLDRHEPVRRPRTRRARRRWQDEHGRHRLSH